MNPVITIAGLNFDIAHVALLAALLLLGLVMFWLRQRAQRSAFAQSHEIHGLKGERERLAQELQTAEDRLEHHRRKLGDAERELAAGTARLETMDRKFAVMANQAIETAHKSFLERADESFKHQNAQARGGLEKMLEPIGKNFAEFKTRVEAIEKVRVEDKSAIQQQVVAIAESLRHNTAETGKLVSALTAPKGGGRWGEMTLRNVMEQAGLSGYCDFSEQVTDRTEEGNQRPDAIINLPGDRQIVVDSKVSLEAYLSAASAENPEQRAAYLKAHAASVQRQIDALASKRYQDNLDERVDFVAMFIPGENFFAAALQHAPDLLERAYARNVIVTTPSTLIGLAKTVSYVWRQEKMTQNAMEAAKLGEELYRRIATMAGHFAKLGSSLNGAVDNFNKASSSLDKRVLPSLRRFEELSIAPPDKALPELKRIEKSADRVDLADEGEDSSEAAA